MAPVISISQLGPGKSAGTQGSALPVLKISLRVSEDIGTHICERRLHRGEGSVIGVIGISRRITVNIQLVGRPDQIIVVGNNAVFHYRSMCSSQGSIHSKALLHGSNKSAGRSYISIDKFSRIIAGSHPAGLMVSTVIKSRISSGAVSDRARLRSASVQIKGDVGQRPDH